MKLAILFCLFALSLSANAFTKFRHGRRYGGNLVPPPESAKYFANIDELYFDQKLDHSDPTNKVLWKQKYYVNDQYFDKTKRNVAFLDIGGEGPASIKWMTSGAWIDTAQQNGALIFQLEHRFYGDSQPFDNLSTENLRYLTSEQAIDDLANFIVAMNKKYELPDDVKWIAFGGSYSGSLAAWLRQKYPHLLLGAMSASGPLLALLDFQEYFRVVKDDMRVLHSQACVDAVQTATGQLEAIIADIDNSPVDVDKLFNLCTPIKNSVANDKDIANFFEIMADNFAGVAQYNDDNRSGGSTINVKYVCDIMTNETIGDELNRLASVNALLQGSDCLDYLYDNAVNYYKNISLSSPAAEGGRQWTYQTCTEFGFYQTSTHEPQVFGHNFPIEFFTQQCADIYGEEFDTAFLDGAIDRTNTIYGALDIKVSNVVFVHGTVDPWHPLGIIETVDEAAPAILINGTAHCANMYSKSEYDLPELTAAREKVDELIAKWLA